MNLRIGTDGLSPKQSELKQESMAHYTVIAEAEYAPTTGVLHIVVEIEIIPVDIGKFPFEASDVESDENQPLTVVG